MRLLLSAVQKRNSAGIKALMTLIISAIVATTFYYRGSEFTPFSMTLVIPAAVVLSLYLFLALASTKSVRIHLGGRAYVLFFSVIIINSILAGLTTGDSATAIRFAVEILLNWGILVILLSAIDSGILRRDDIITIIVIFSVPLSLQIIYKAATINVVRRIGSNIEILSAVNHAGHSLAISTIFCIYLAAKYIRRSGTVKQILIFIVFALNVSALLLTMSRGSVLGFAFGFLLITSSVYVEISSAKKWVILAIITFFISYLIYWVVSNEKFAALISRLTYTALSTGIERRLDVAYDALSSLNYVNIIIGQPSRYEPIADTDAIKYPHNILVSILVHGGLLPLILFIWIMISRMYKMIVRTMFEVRKRVVSAALTASVIPIITYALTSGRLTRIMTIFVIMALIETER